MTKRCKMLGTTAGPDTVALKSSGRMQTDHRAAGHTSTKKAFVAG